MAPDSTALDVQEHCSQWLNAQQVFQEIGEAAANGDESTGDGIRLE